MNSPTPITSLLSTTQASGLRQLMQRCEQLRALQRQLHQCLDLNLMGHCRLVNLQGQSLILAVPSPAWATRMRYQLPTLLSCLQAQQGMRHIKEIQIRVHPANDHETPRQAPRPVSLSAQSAMLIADCAEHINDAALSQALFRLARHGQDRPSPTDTCPDTV